jgi:pilus assembly protein CpaC
MSFLHSKNFQKLLLFALLLALVVTIPTIVSANPKIRVTVGQSVTQSLETNVKTVSIADSDVADVVVAGPREVLINGKRIGLTTLVVWDQDNVSQVFDVVVRGPFSDRKIELRVQLAEVNRTAATELGFDFLGDADASGDSYLGGLYGGSVDSPTIPLSIFGGKPVQGASAIFQFVSDDGDVFQSMIHAAVSNGVLKVLAEPNVVAASGEEAEFLSGGEIPIPIAVSGTTGGTQITVEWKEFGVKVKFKPTIIDSNVVNLQIAPSVSSLDYGNAIEISGFLLPALRSRKASTTVELRDGEVLVIGGLLMEEEEEFRTRIPILGHIPILGYLFSDSSKIKTETELMLVVSPRIVRALPPGSSVALPGRGTEE